MSQAHTRTEQTVEPLHLGHEESARFLNISPRLLDEFVRRGEILPVKIPGVRRRTYIVAELREMGRRWAATRGQDGQ